MELRIEIVGHKDQQRFGSMRCNRRAPFGQILMSHDDVLQPQQRFRNEIRNLASLVSHDIPTHQNVSDELSFGRIGRTLWLIFQFAELTDVMQDRTGNHE